MEHSSIYSIIKEELVMGIMERMMKYWMNRMSKEEKQRIMSSMMQEFLKGMSKEEKRQMMSD
ncbi:MAG: hypothetical protein H3Z53_08315 [archaeon]|nr:hypothetical protein [archaeon]